MSMRLQAEQLSFRYEDGAQAVQDISLSIHEGTLTVLCGVNGSGKSTLLRLLAGLERPSSGRIIAGEAENPDHKAKDGDGAAMVFQQPETQLFAGSVHKDIEYGLKERGVPKSQRIGLIRDALASTGLPYEQFAQRSPFLLSGGEKRRVTIAGAIASRPGLLILDEPTAGLDPQAAQSLLKTVVELRQSGLTLIIGTHDLDSFLPLADRAIVMKRGAVHYDGPAARLAADPLLLPEAGLSFPAYASIGRRLLKQGLLAAMPGSLEELLTALGGQTLPAPPAGGGVRTDGCGYPDTLSLTGDCGKQRQAEAQSAQAPATASAPASALSTAAAPSVNGPSASVPAEGEQRTASRNQPAVLSPAIAREAAPGRLRWQGLDPRVKWLGMLIGSLVVLGMDTLLPLLLTASLLTALGASAGIPWRRALRFFRPFLLMFLFLWLLSALSWNSPDFTLGPLGFSSAGILRGGINVLRFLLLIILGFLFTETTGGAPLREGLEWAIAPLKSLGIRTRNWSLAVSVTLQFIPWIIGKLAQLQLALSSRGRRARGLARWSPRQIALLIVPLLILVLGMGDELSTAIESRGYDPEKQRTPAYRLAWSSRDTLATLFIIGAAALLYGLSRLS